MTSQWHHHEEQIHALTMTSLFRVVLWPHNDITMKQAVTSVMVHAEHYWRCTMILLISDLTGGCCSNFSPSSNCGSSPMISGDAIALWLWRWGREGGGGGRGKGGEMEVVTYTWSFCYIDTCDVWPQSHIYAGYMQTQWGVKTGKNGEGRTIMSHVNAHQTCALGAVQCRTNMRCKWAAVAEANKADSLNKFLCLAD